MAGDSMNDGTVNSIADGDFVRAVLSNPDELEPDKKYVIEHHDGGFYICVIHRSYNGQLYCFYLNPEHGRFEMPVADVKAIYRIKLIERNG